MSLSEAVGALDEAVSELLNSGKASNGAVLSAIFLVNQEIGRQLRPSGEPSLKSLQLEVNEVTKAAKRQDKEGLRSAMDRVRDQLSKLPPRYRAQGSREV